MSLPTSLYELVTATEPLLTAVQVSPATLKAAIASTIDLLIDHQIAATLWLKVPTDVAWQEDVERYAELAIGTIYTLVHTQADSPVDTPDLTEFQPLDLVLPLVDGSVSEAIGAEDGATLPTISLPIEADTFRREYFLLVVSEQWCSLLLAHRPRSSQSAIPVAPSPELVAITGTDLADVYLLEESSATRKHPLLLVNSLAGDTLHQALTSIQQAIVSASSAQTALPDITWADQFERCRAVVPHPTWITSLLTRQLQRQEDLWRQIAGYRRQGATLEALRSQNQGLLRELKLKDEFLNNVGQELRTPLTNMKTALTLLNSPSLKPPQRLRYMQMLSTECDRQSSLITSMLDLVQLDYTADHDPLQPILLADVIPGVVSTYQPLAQEKGLMLAYTISEELPAVLCLSTWLRQITVNLLYNAIKFTLTGGRVWVRAKQQGDYIQIEFQDTGVGIPPHEIPKIFDRFYRVRHTSAEDVSGVGLGLTIVQQILLRCGGSISVKSRVNEGSTFNVLLPIAKNSGASQ